MPTLTNVTTANTYADIATLRDVFGSPGGWFAVTGNPVYVQLGYPGAGGALTAWGEEIGLPQGATGDTPPGCCGIRFRSLNAGKAATVSAGITVKGEYGLSLTAYGQTSLTGTASYLGSFTVAQWPPQNPTQGDAADFADTSGGVSFDFALVYRPDIDATYPWSSAALLAGALGDYADAFFNPNGPVATGSWANVGSLAVPRAGIYNWQHQDSQTTVAGTHSTSFGVATTATGTPSTTVALSAAAPGDVKNGGETLKQFTLAQGASIYLNANSNNASAVAGLCVLGWQPVRIA